MSDQANDLRQLVLRGARPHLSPAHQPPQLLVVTSGKGGVGTTTVAVNLAVALARDGRRVVLVDADFQNADATKLCCVDATETVADVLAGRRSVHEALKRGPAGVLVLPGVWGGQGLVDCPEAAQRRLLTQLNDLGAYADFVIVDVGSGANRVVERFCGAADRILLVTTPESMAIMDTYAAIKMLGRGQPGLPLYTLVNRAAGAAAAEDVHLRLARASKRFLALQLTLAGQLGDDPAVAQATADCRPFLTATPDCPTAAQMEQLALLVTQTLSLRSNASRAA